MTTTYPLHTPEFFVGDPYPVYKQLRATSPVHWHEEGRFWALMKYEDIRYVSSNPGKFSSARGVMMPDLIAAVSEMDTGRSDMLMFSDPPRHRQLRKLISAGFTRRQISYLETKIRELVHGIVDDIPAGSTLEYAENIAAPLPTRLIAEMLGAPPSDWALFRSWTDAFVGTADPEVELDAFVAAGQLFEYFEKLVAARRITKTDDILSVLTHAEVDGERLTDNELMQFAFLLLVAGNETTRNLIALGTLALISHPEQTAQLRADPGLIPGAVEEMLRWTTPVTHMGRVATEDVEIRGQQIRKDDFVIMFYGSANRDEEIFGANSEDFDITRSPNPHIAFGCGEHACIGAQLARLEATIMFEELLKRYTGFELLSDVERMRATMVPGVKRMTVRLGE